MPNAIDTNIRSKILRAVQLRLSTISIADGYQTQPTVASHWMEAEKASTKYALWAQTGTEEMEPSGTNQRHTCALEIHVGGFIREGIGDLQEDTNKLIQDVRSCIAAYGSGFRDLIATGGLVGFDTCETDEGALLETERAYFTQTVVFNYVQDKDW